MSHVTNINVQIKDLAALKAATEYLGGAMHDRQNFISYNGRQNKCDQVLSFPGAGYEVGVMQEGEVYGLKWDPYYQGGLEPILGRDANNLRREYSAQEVIALNNAKGIRLVRTNQENGHIRLEAA